MNKNILDICAAALVASALFGCGGGTSDVTSASPPARMQASAPAYSTDNLYQFFAVAFNAAPGVTYMGQLLDAANAGMSIKDIVNVFTSKDQFTLTYPLTLTDAEFANRLTANVVGTSATAQAKQTAINDILQALAAPGWTRGDVIYAVFNNLAKMPPTDQDWGGTSTKMKNQVVYAKYYTEVMLGDSTIVDTLQRVIRSVTETSDITTGIQQAIQSSLTAPTVSISLSTPKVAVHTPLTISWVATDATSCVGSDALPSVQPVNGNATVTQAFGGQYTYTITCTGAGGSATAKATSIVPMKVFGTSYENKNSIPFDATQVPRVRALGIAKVVSGEQDSVDRSIAFGDFFQEGKYSAFVMAGNSDGAYGPNLPGDIPGVGYFLAQDASGKWIDRSNELFKTTTDRMGCISPSFAAVADFNNDGRPDIYIACTGFDFSIPGLTWEQNVPFGRSFGVLYLSQADGSYKSKRIEEANPMYGHKAVAVDIDGDGNIDIITTDFVDPNQPLGCGAPYVLRGHGDGTFTRDYSFIDVNFVRSWGASCGFFDVDIIPIDGRYDIMIGGLVNDRTGQGLWSVLWMKGKPGGFDPTTAITMQMPMDSLSNSQFQFPLDIIYDAQTSAIYMKTTASVNYGDDWAIVKFDQNGSLIGVIDNWLRNWLPRSPQFKPSYSNPGYLEAYSGECDVDVTLGDCGRKIKMN